VAVPADRYVVQKEEEKELKYESLFIDVQRMQKMECMIIPAIIGTSGIVTKS